MHIIPAIDLIDGVCVRLSGGDYESKKIYEKDPLVMAKRFEDAGLTHVHLVDLDGAKQGHIVNGSVLERIARHTSLVIDFGGGVRTDADLSEAFSRGAKLVTCGSVAVKDREKTLSWLAQYGPERLILGADCNHGLIATSAWLESSGLDVVSFVSSYAKEGFTTCISTDIAEDGMLSGPSFSLYEKLMKKEKGMHFIASGGVSCVSDLEILAQKGLFGAIVGKAFYEGRISLAELSRLEEYRC